jgi:hypothetical protein
VREFINELCDEDAAEEGRRGQVLLALDGFSKKSQRTPPEKIDLAERRLRDWRSRGTRRTSVR